MRTDALLPRLWIAPLSVYALQVKGGLSVSILVQDKSRQALVLNEGPELKLFGPVKELDHLAAVWSDWGVNASGSYI